MKLATAVLTAFIASVVFVMDAAAQPQELFQAVDESTLDLTQSQGTVLSYLRSKKWTIAATVVKLNTASFNDQSLTLNFADQFSLELDRKKAVFSDDKMVWKAAPSDIVQDVTFVRRGENVTGTVRINNRLYSVRPLGGGLHAVVERNESEFPPDHPPEFEREMLAVDPQRFRRLVDRDATMDVPAVYQIDVMVFFTPAVAEVVADVPSLIDLAVEETNDSYSDSDINAVLNLVHQAKVTYTESGSFKTDVERLAGTADGQIDGIHAVRNQKKADVVVLLIDDDQACGRAMAIVADVATAFAVVHHDCATGYYSFGHEIGHLQGARHNPEADPTNIPYAFGHGYYNAAKHWRTVMSYNCSGGCVRQKFWSNPDKTYGGDPTGTEETHDNARVLDITAPTVAGFK